MYWLPPSLLGQHITRMFALIIRPCSLRSLRQRNDIFNRWRRYITYVFWNILALPQCFYYEGYLTWLQFEKISTFLDLLTKTVYAITLLTGNFCILDVVLTLRLATSKANRKYTGRAECNEGFAPNPITRRHSI